MPLQGASRKPLHSRGLQALLRGNSAITPTILSMIRPRQAKLQRTFGSFFQKWTFDLPMNRVVSRRHGFEANTNRFTLVPYIHLTKSVDHLRQEASISQR